MKRESGRRKDRRAARCALAAIMLCLCALLAVFYHRTLLLGGAVVLTAALDILLGAGSRGRRLLIFDLAVLLPMIPAMVIGSYIAVLIAVTVSFVSAAVLFFCALKKKKRSARMLLAVLFVVLLAVPPALDWCPDPLFRFVMQQGVMAHTAQPEDTVRADGVRVLRDLTYTSAYPNNTANLFLAKENRGTVFYIHGGGFVLGDKDVASQNGYLEKWIENGYNVAAIDYALAPQYRIEKQIVQCGEALAWFFETAPVYGIDPARTVLAGDSAGGCLSGLLTAAYSSPAAAARLGVAPSSANGGRIRAWISVGSVSDAKRIGDTNLDTNSWGFNLMGVCAFGSPAYAGSEAAQAMSVLHWVNADFPPCYLSDGNTGTFTDQAQDTAAALAALGVRAEIHIVPIETAKRLHVFELDAQNDPVAAENFQKTLAFVNDVIN